VLETYPGARLYEFTEEDKKKIQQLRDEKYATYDWNFGHSPEYNFKKAIRTNGGLLEMNLEVKNGIIEKAKIFGDFFSEKGISDIENALVNKHHEEKELRSVLSHFPIEKHFRNIDLDDLINAMF
jgi:lipoate-protein ligase A